MSLEDKVHEAMQRSNQGYNCAQSVFAAISPELGLEPTEALRVAAAFGGGVARSGNTCGAVTGSLMAIGLLTDGQANPEEKERIYRLASEFMDRFARHNRSLNCRELTGCDLSTPEGRELAKRQQIMAQKCPPLIKNALEILEQMGVVKTPGK